MRIKKLLTPFVFLVASSLSFSAFAAKKSSDFCSIAKKIAVKCHKENKESPSWEKNDDKQCNVLFGDFLQHQPIEFADAVTAVKGCQKMKNCGESIPCLGKIITDVAKPSQKTPAAEPAAPAAPAAPEKK